MLTADQFFEVYPALRTLTNLGEYLWECVEGAARDDECDAVTRRVKQLNQRSDFSGEEPICGLLEIVERLQKAIQHPLIQTIEHDFVEYYERALTAFPRCQTCDELEDACDDLEEGQFALYEYLAETESKLLGFFGSHFFNSYVNLKWDFGATMLTEDAFRRIVPNYGPLHRLQEWATQPNGLKGKQRRVIELLTEHRGQVKLKDLASDPEIRWEAPYDEAWNSICKQLKKRLRAQGWIVFRHDNEARLEQRMGQK